MERTSTFRERQPGRSRPPETARDDDTPLLDFQMIEELRQLDEGEGFFLRELITAFLDHAGELMQQLARAREQGDRYGVVGAVHGLKGASLNMGALALGAYCRNLERQLRANPRADLDGAMQTLLYLYDRSCQALKALGDTADAP
ncbi:MAG: Hpt domain-containing protein [Bacteroidetes bacterium]|nr:MAG: Hpt domain-containing protein [Bacteroidota bacterium]